MYCKEYNNHHGSSCPTRYGTEQTVERVNLSEEVIPCANSEEEKVMVSAGETVLMQTVNNPISSQYVNTRLLFDRGSQRTYVSKALADQLGLKLEKVEELKLVTFGRSESRVVKIYLTTLNLKLNSGCRTANRSTTLFRWKIELK